MYLSETPLRHIATPLRLILAVAMFSCLHAQVTTFDSQGNVYIGTSPQAAVETITPGAFQSTFVVATCSSTPNPLGSPDFYACPHGYVSKVTPDGSKVLAGTYLGGSGGDGISAIAVDRAGNIYVAGGTSSTDFPVTADAYQKTPGTNFLSVLSPDGTKLLHSTFLNFVSLSAIAIDPAGRVLVAGSVTAGAFPGSFPPGSDTRIPHPFLAAFSPQLSGIDYAVAMEGTDAGAVSAMAIDGLANVYVTGVGGTGNIFKMFLTKLDTYGVKLWTFTFGGSQSDTPYTLSVNAAGEAYIVGVTVSPDFPVTPGAFRAPSDEPFGLFIQAFATKVSTDGSHFIYSGLLPDIGGPMLAAIDNAGDLMIVGEFPGPTVFPSTPDSSRPCLNAAESQSGAGVFFELAPDGSHPVYAAVLPPTNVTPGMTSWLVGLKPNGQVLVGSQTKVFDIIDTNSQPSHSVTCIANAANYRSGAVAPGEIVSLFGPAIGPKQPASLQLVNGTVSSDLAGVQVQVNGVPAPLLYVSESQINAVIPFEIAGQAQATVQVVNQGVKLPQITVPIAAAAPGIFTLDFSGAGQSAAINQDGSINSVEHPAPPGSIVAVFLTGAGQMAPSVKDGSLGNGKTKPVLPISGQFDQQPLVTTYVGDTPTLVQGVIQVNCVVPAVLQYAGAAHHLVISFGSANLNVAAAAGIYAGAK